MAEENRLQQYAGLSDRLPVPIASPSFVWPAGWADNSERLAPIFPYIQLLLHEPLHRSPLPAAEMARLTALAERGTRFLIHMPVPGGLDDPQRDAVSEYLDIIRTTRPLDPQGYVIHLEGKGDTFNGTLARERLFEIIVKSGLSPDLLLAENLNDRFPPLFDAVADTGVAVCLDWGHILRDGGDPVMWAARYGERIKAAHIHGVDGSRDHVPLSRLPGRELTRMMNTLAGLNMPGPAVIENYSPEHMAASLEALAEIYGEE